MGNGVSVNQGNLPPHGSRDAKTSVCQEQHDWLEQAEAPETHSLLADRKSYTTFNPPIPTTTATMHTDGQTDDIVMPTGDHNAYCTIG